MNLFEWSPSCTFKVTLITLLLVLAETFFTPAGSWGSCRAGRSLLVRGRVRCGRWILSSITCDEAVAGARSSRRLWLPRHLLDGSKSRGATSPQTFPPSLSYYFLFGTRLCYFRELRSCSFSCFPKSNWNENASRPGSTSLVQTRFKVRARTWTVYFFLFNNGKILAFASVDMQSQLITQHYKILVPLLLNTINSFGALFNIVSLTKYRMQSHGPWLRHVIR
jgi:hypothetical protein